MAGGRAADEIRATLMDRVINRGLIMAEAGQRGTIIFIQEACIEETKHFICRVTIYCNCKCKCIVV